MTEQKLEAILVEKFEGLGFPCVCSTFGRSFEDGSSSVVTVKVGNRSQQTWEIGQFDIPFTVYFDQRVETDEDKEMFLDGVEKIVDLIAGWSCRSGSANVARDFTIAGEFTPAYFHVEGGQNAYDRTKSAFSYEQSFTIRGYIQ